MGPPGLQIALKTFPRAPAAGETTGRGIRLVWFSARGQGGGCYTTRAVGDSMRPVARAVQSLPSPPPRAPAAGEATEVVISGRTGSAHVVMIGGASIPPSGWESRCARFLTGAARPAQDGME